MMNMKDMQQTLQRRSSVKNLQVQEELRNVVPHDVFKNCPELQKIGRLSGNASRNSTSLLQRGPGGGGGGGAGGNPRGSCIPTPTLGAGRGARPTTSASRNLSLAGGSGLRSGGPSQGSSARPGSAGPGSSRGGGRGTSASRTGRQPIPPARGSGMNMKPPNAVLARVMSNSNLSTTLNNTRRKSKSYESLLFQTPAYNTPGRSRSKSPSVMSTNRRRNLINDAADQGKNVKITKDKKVQAEMARYIIDFLDAQGCQSKPAQVKDLVNPPTIHTSTFISIMKFLASHFVGESFFRKTKPGDDDLMKIMEVSKLLKYPGTITKSHLQTPNAQHAWPSCLAFLAWLCCRTQALINPPQERSGIDELASNGMHEFAFESYLNLFPAHFNRTLTQEAVDEELANFKARVFEAHGVELTKSKDELLQERNERKAELEKLQNEVDPSKEFKARFDEELKVRESLAEKIKETEIKCKNYGNTNHLVLQLERLELEIEARTSEIAKLNKQLESQTLSKQDASVVLNETEVLKVQLASLNGLIEQLTIDYDNRTKKVNTFRNQLYELCTTFSIVERYNEIARFLQMNNLVIAPNPFAPKELEDWMKIATKTLRQAEARVKDMVHQVEISADQKTKDTMEYQQQVESLQKHVSDLSSKLQSAERYNRFLSADCDKKYKVEEIKLAEVTEFLQHEEGELNKVLENKNSLKQAHQEWTESLISYRNCAEEWKEKLLKEVETFQLEVMKAKTFMENATREASRNQQQLYQELFGIDISPDDNNTTG